MLSRILVLAILAISTSAGANMPATEFAPPDAAGSASTVVVSGKVVTIAGDGLRKAVVTLEPLKRDAGAPNATYSAISDTDGAFTFNAVEPGTYYLRAERAGYLRQSFGGKPLEYEGKPVAVSAAGTVGNLTIRLTPEAVVTGRVVDLDGEGVGSVGVKLYRFAYDSGRRRFRPVSEATTDSDGVFKIAGLAPGQYHLVAAPRGPIPIPQRPDPSSASGAPAEMGYVTTYYPGTRDAAAAQALDVAPGARSALGDIRLQAARLVHVRGRVEDAGERKGRRHLVVRALSEDPDTAAGLLGAPTSEIRAGDGAFDLAGVSEGSYAILVTTVTGRIETLARRPLAVGSSDINDFTIALSPPIEVTGKIIYAPAGSASPESARLGVPDAFVVLIPSSAADFNAPGQSSTGGAFTIPSVSPGRYLVRVTQLPEGAYIKSVRLGIVDLLANDLDLSSGSGSFHIAIELSRAVAQVSGLITDGEGRPLADKVTTIAPKSLDRHRPDLYARAVSAADGRFALSNLAPGEYCVYPWDDLDAGEEFNIDRLQSAGRQCTAVKLDENATQSVGLTVQSSGASGSGQ